MSCPREVKTSVPAGSWCQKFRTYIGVFYFRLMKSVLKPLFKLLMNWRGKTFMNLTESNRGLFSSLITSPIRLGIT